MSGQGMGTRRRGMGRIYARSNSPCLWIEYWHLGRRYRESCGSHLEAVARKLLRLRLGEIARKGRVANPELERLTYGEVEALLLADIEANRRPNYLASATRRVKHLRQAFGNLRALEITYDRLARYKAARLRSAKPATIRLELALMGRMLRLAHKAGRLETVPPIPTVAVDNARQGFCSPEEIDRVLAHLPAHVAPVVRVLYDTGMRTHEALQLEWSRVDFDAQSIQLRGSDTKTHRPRVIPFPSRVAAILREQRDLAMAGSRITSGVFPDVSASTFKRWWLRAVRAAGLPALRPHDLRRSFARNAVRSGVSEGVVMALTGHRTRSMLDRYNITAAADLFEAMRRMDASQGVDRHTDRHTCPPAGIDRRANQLRDMELVTGIEPVTPSLRVTCSTS